ncbi:hypothetical protein E2C01_015563 [Portunus trituberculatus]|uniref:Uncharacterized protein n=1 Tax=Portunus trituberculatus TaxID=210409 RepID=A0A5B7DN49_PORTR|nr:hypothetical protein [Portunus trituberculatus]
MSVKGCQGCQGCCSMSGDSDKRHSSSQGQGKWWEEVVQDVVMDAGDLFKTTKQGSKGFPGKKGELGWGLLALRLATCTSFRLSRHRDGCRLYRSECFSVWRQQCCVVPDQADVSNARLLMEGGPAPPYRPRADLEARLAGWVAGQTGCPLPSVRATGDKRALGAGQETWLPPAAGPDT